MKKLSTLLVFICLMAMVSNSTALAQASCVGTATLNVTINTCVTGELVKATALLQGAYSTGGQMQVSSGFFNQIPLTQPYQSAPWGYGGSESIASRPANMIDWVLLEVYNAADTSLLETKAALLLNNGSIVDVSYISNPTVGGVYFQSVVANSAYYLVVRHRNHMAIISRTTVTLPNAGAYNFTNFNNVMGGAPQVANMGSGYYALLAGDYSANGIISVVDYNGYAQLPLPQPNSYVDNDFNLDANVTTADFNLYRPNSSAIGMPAIRY